MNKQHVQVPNMEINNSILFSDPYIYACIKKYMNKDTKQAYPAIQTIVETSGLNKKTILSSIDRLEKANYISVIRRSGAPNIYVFNEYTKFEIFSYEFLENKGLSPKAKSYLVIMQHEMKKDPNTAIWDVQYNQVQIAEKLGISLPTLRKIEKELIEYGTLSMTQSNTLELIKTPEGQMIPLTGLKNCIRHYDLATVCNTVALKFIEHDIQIENNTKNIEELQTELVTTKEELEALKERSDRKDKYIYALENRVQTLEELIKTPIKQKETIV